MATYGVGAYFTFSSLDPQLPACPPAFISGITVTTNKATGTFNLPGAATFGPHSVTVQIAGSANLNWNPGEFVLVRLNFACATPPTQLDPCCPPWNKDVMKDMLQLVGPSLSAPYTLKFVPTQVFSNQMQTYLNYVHSTNNSITSITIDWRLHDQGTSNPPFSSYGTQIGAATVTWNWNTTNIGAPIISPANFFTVTAPHMMVGEWYTVHTGTFLTGGHFFPDTCANNDINVRLQVLGARGAPSGGGGGVLEFFDGKKAIKSIPIGDGKQQQQR